MSNVKKVILDPEMQKTIKVTFYMNMTCEANCSAIMEHYQDDAIFAIKNGLKRDLKKWLGVTLKEIDVKVVNIDK